MARPTKAVVDYFPHYVSSGKTMFTLEGRYKNDGYAFWFKVLELLGSNEGHFIDCNKPNDWEFLLAKTRVTEIDANGMLDLLAKLDAIDQELWEKRVIWSQNFVDNLASLYSRRKVNAPTKPTHLGLCMQKPGSSAVNDIENPQSIVKKRKEKETSRPSAEVIPENLNTPEFLATWEEWQSFRVAKRNKLTPASTKKQLEMLSEYSPKDAAKILNNSIMNGWTGLFPEKVAQKQEQFREEEPLELSL